MSVAHEYDDMQLTIETTVVAMNAPINMAVKRLHPDAKLPVKARTGDSGFDVFAHVDPTIRIQPGERATIGTGIALELPPGWEAQVRPRSGMASKAGVIATFGTIDNGYRGEIGITLQNLGNWQHVVNCGDKIAQLCIARVPDVRVVEVEELSETERGAGGFGHTGER